MEITTEALAAELKARGFNVKANGAAKPAGNSFKIEANIPIPASRFGRGNSGTSKYPHASLKVGESFFVPISSEPGLDCEALQNRLGVAVRVKANGRKFATRQMADKSGVRVWRTA